jgi:hypothetical protein
MKKLNVLVYNDISVAILDWLKKSYDVNVLKYNQGAAVKNADLVLLHGEQSGNVPPKYYTENTGKHTNVVDKYWDRYSYLSDAARSYHVPILAIEEGAEFMTTVCGGRLIQYTTLAGNTTQVSYSSVTAGSTKCVNKNTQLMYPYDLSPEKYNIKAWNRYFGSAAYLNGDNEEMELPNDFLEIQVIEYKINKTKCLAIQNKPAEHNASGREVLSAFLTRFLK